MDFTDLDALYREYFCLRKNAPSRTSRGKKYFVGHDGIPSTRGHSNRREEHSAIALVNLQHHWKYPPGGGFRFLDYQVSLRTQQTDTGVGKVDIVGIRDDGRLILTELKVESKQSRSSDTPFSALLQGLRYAAIVEKNLEVIAHEAKGCFGVEVKQLPPIVQLLATVEWWQQQSFDFTAPGKSQERFASLVDGIENKTGVCVECQAFDCLKISIGSGGKKPRLDPKPNLEAVPLR
ncbi:MAG: hypothetical protein V6Z81_05005 [Parvularculales bacterium]